MNRQTEADQVGLAVILHGLKPYWTIYCPQCAHPLADAFQNRIRARQGRIWLQTTEGQPDLAARLRTWETRGPNPTTSLDWGQCPCCSAEFYLIAVHLRLQEEAHTLDRTLNTTASEPLHLAQACHESIPSGWLAAQVCTPLGLVHQHVFGPIPLETDPSIWIEATLGRIWADLLIFARHKRPWPDGCLTPSSAQPSRVGSPLVEHDPLF